MQDTAKFVECLMHEARAAGLGEDLTCENAIYVMVNGRAFARSAEVESAAGGVDTDATKAGCVD